MTKHFLNFTKFNSKSYRFIFRLFYWVSLKLEIVKFKCFFYLLIVVVETPTVIITITYKSTNSNSTCEELNYGEDCHYMGKASMCRWQSGTWEATLISKNGVASLSHITAEELGHAHSVSREALIGVPRNIV